MKMYKLPRGISTTKIQEPFRFRSNRRYNLSSQNTFEISFRNSVYNGTESISYLWPNGGSLSQITGKALLH